MKSHQVDVLSSQLSTLVFADKADLSALKIEADKAASKRDEEQAKLSQAYSTSVITAAKIYLKQMSGGAILQYVTELVSDAPKETKTMLPENILKDISTQLNSISQQNYTVLQANRALTEALAAVEKSKAMDTKAQQAILERQIKTLREDIVDLDKRHQVAISVEESTDKPDLDSVSLPRAGDERWQEIWIDSEVSDEMSDSSSFATASSTSTHVNLWIGSNSTNSNKAEAGVKSKEAGKRHKVSLGLRITLVTVDRSGWFQPQFLDMSSAFMRTSTATKWSDWPAEWKTTEDVKNHLRKDTGGFEKSFFPAFPVG